MKCPKCAAPAPPKGKFCSQCGAKLGAQCSACNELLPAGTKFCPQCGTPTGAASSEATAPISAQLVATKPKFAGDRRIVTVLFTDVSGFTAMSEKLDPEAVTEIINNFFRVLVEPIYRYGGTVDKYIGDAIMALFGAPIAHEDDAERAVRAAWEMQLRAKEHAAELEQRTGILLKVRIGLNTGLVVAGEVGGSQRSDYTVMGDTVNLAQRMEANAKVGKVLVTAETYQQTKAAFQFQALEPIKVKGKAEPVEVYELVAPQPRTMFLRPDEALVGRNDELAQLMACLESAGAGRVQWVLVRGEAGVGKSALVKKFLAFARGAGVQVAQARMLSYEQDTAYALVSSLLQDWMNLAEVESAASINDRLKGFVDAWLPEDQQSVGLLGHLLGLPTEDSAVGSLSPRQLRTGAFMALNEVILNCARKGPLLISIDSLHWADEASLEWLNMLLDRLGNEPVPAQMMIVCQSRQEAGSTQVLAVHERIESTTVTLGPLHEDQALALVTLQLGTMPEALKPPAQALIRRVLERSEGNPFYLAEMLRELIEGEVLLRSGATWSTPKGIEGLTLPTTVRATISSRLDRLPVPLRKWVQIAAVVGRRVDPALLAEIAQEQPGEAIGELVSLKLFYQKRDGEVGFGQAIIQEVAYETLLIAHRRELHRLVGEALERQATDGGGNFSDVLARHFVQAEDAAKAARYLFASAERARATFSNVEALSLYQSALVWLEKCQAQRIDAGVTPHAINLHVATVQILLGEVDGALASISAHDDLGGKTSTSARFRGDALERRGDFPRAQQALQEAIELAGQDQLEAALAKARLANIHRRLGAYETAIKLCREAQPIVEANKHTAEAGFIHGLIGVCCQRVNDLEGALREHSEALRLREQARDIEGVALSHNNIGMVKMTMAHWAEAHQHYSKALAIFRKLGDRPHVAMELNNLGDLLCKQGEDVLAERHFRESLKLAQQLGDLVNQLTSWGSLGESLISQGRASEALECYRRCVAIMETTGHNEFAPDIHLGLARAHAMLEDFARSQTELELARSEAKATGNIPFEGLVDQAAAELAERSGNVEQARILAERSVTTLRSSGLQLEFGRSLALLARLSSDPAAQAYRQEAAKVFETLGSKKDLALLGMALPASPATGRILPA